MYNVREALPCSMNLFPTENYLTAVTKRVISSMQSFAKKRFLEEREKILER